MIKPQTPSNPVIFPSNASLGVMLREWRAARRLSQLDLALDADISARHLSYIETGKAQPSREVLMRLADALEMPLRERNGLLVVGGFAPIFRETGLGTPKLVGMKQAIEAILAQQEPYPAFVLDRRWNIIQANAAAARVNDCVTRGAPALHDNMMRQIFSPGPFRDAVANWHEIAGDLLRHLYQEVAMNPADRMAKGLLDECLRYPDVPASWRFRDLSAGPSPMVTTVLRHPDGRVLQFFSTITSFATPYDVTLDELRIECCFPLDQDTAAICRDLRDGKV